MDQTIPSLQSYLLIEQERRYVDFYRSPTGWQAEHYSDGALPNTLSIECREPLKTTSSSPPEG
ncbi:MAG: hypothetical protein HKUEN07_07000 [Rhodocyclaceae bacterium]|nr:MAG: hypothetical protein HKUEN07_07000 [Rhodocyclaceae bacterium]